MMAIEPVAGGFELRSALPADAPAIARLHVAVWRETYRNLAPAIAYEALDETLRRRRWNEILAATKPRQSALVAECAGGLAGFGLAGPAEDPAFGGRSEVKFLYVDLCFQRRGIGRAMLARLAQDMMAAGFPGIALGVVAGNDRAIAFYEGLGGRQVGNYIDPGPLWRSENLIYAWDGPA